jgi:hypothetical protein
VRLAETQSQNCDLEACSQPTMLRRMHRLLAPGDSYRAFTILDRELCGRSQPRDGAASALAKATAVEP